MDKTTENTLQACLQDHQLQNRVLTLFKSIKPSLYKLTQAYPSGHREDDVLFTREDCARIVLKTLEDITDRNEIRKVLG